MLQTSCLLILWLAACALLPARVVSWATSPRQDARMAAKAHTLQAAAWPTVQMTELRVTGSEPHSEGNFFSSKPQAVNK